MRWTPLYSWPVSTERNCTLYLSAEATAILRFFKAHYPSVRPIQDELCMPGFHVTTVPDEWASVRSESGCARGQKARRRVLTFTCAFATQCATFRADRARTTALCASALCVCAYSRAWPHRAKELRKVVAYTQHVETRRSHRDKQRRDTNVCGNGADMKKAGRKDAGKEDRIRSGRGRGPPV